MLRTAGLNLKPGFKVLQLAEDGGHSLLDEIVG